MVYEYLPIISVMYILYSRQLRRIIVQLLFYSLIIIELIITLDYTVKQTGQAQTVMHVVLLPATRVISAWREFWLTIWNAFS